MSRWVFALLLLASCTEDSGCMPGHFISNCARSCAPAGVSVVLPAHNVCVCNRPETPRAAP